MSISTKIMSRRGFFGTFGRASAAAAVVTVADAEVAGAYDPGEDERRPRYRETDEVKAFYRTNRYEQ